MDRKKRKLFALNHIEIRILALVFLSATIPILILIGFFYFFFYDLIYVYLKSAMAYNFLVQFIITSVILFLYYFILVGVVAYYFVHKFAGALPRALRELDERIKGKAKSHIFLRKGDYGKEIIDRINALLDKLS